MMKSALFLLCAAGTSLAACASTSQYTTPVQVTRFVDPAGAPIGSGTIAVEAAPGGEGDSLLFAAYRDAVTAELAQLGYTVTNNDSSAQVAEVRLESFTERAGRDRGPVSVGVGGSTGTYGSGVGLGLGIDLSGPPPEILSSELGVTIRDRATRSALWEGRSSFATRADGELADPRANAARLADALFEDWPGENGETISVE